MKKVKVYISGKITGEKDYRKKFKKAEDALKAAGFDVLNPAKIKHKKGADYAYYYWQALEMLREADCVLFLPCAKDSPGARCEKEIVKLCKKPYVDFITYDFWE